MLIHLHVKNFALIDEIEADFTEGLNILTGETGAGKSILLGSINLALGAKADKDVIREGCEYAFVELLFRIENDYQREVLKEMDIFPDDDILIIQRKILPNRSISKICSETVTTSRLRSVAGMLLDIYGQHDYQNLLQPKRHIEFLDSFAGAKISEPSAEVKKYFREYNEILKSLNAPEMDSETRLKEIDFALFEVNEIENAGLSEGEEEDLSAYLKKAENGERVIQALNTASFYLKDMDESAQAQIGRSLRELSGVSDCDSEVSDIYDRLSEIDSLLSDLSRDISRTTENFDFDPESLANARERFDVINRLSLKYGRTIPDILAYGERRKTELEKLQNSENIKAELEKKLASVTVKLENACVKLSEARKSEALKLEKQICEALKDLNFEEAAFKVNFEKTDYSGSGFDNVSFYISTNKGESLKLLSSVASGGELSRIMLAIKTVIADNEGTNTLIFDEIDAGISGKTAWKVSEKLGILASQHQVICITHLPQIAAMADNHFRIYKESDDNKTHSHLENLSKDESLNELARLLGSDEISAAALENARALKSQAEEIKSMQPCE